MIKRLFFQKYGFFFSYFYLSCVVILFALAFSKSTIKASLTDTQANVFKDEHGITVILDAGHGGEDGGASSEDGLLEKDLNLKICESVRDMLVCFGVDVRMTRTEDKLLYTDEQNIKGQRKLYDLKNRYLIATEYENPVFISVHINKFSQSKYKGLQVYYSKNNLASQELANTIQCDIKDYLQNDNNRKIKEGSSTIYLLDRLKCPAVLIECGFLSNSEDCENFKNDEYIKKMSAIISNSILENLK